MTFTLCDFIGAEDRCLCWNSGGYVADDSDCGLILGLLILKRISPWLKPTGSGPLMAALGLLILSFLGPWLSPDDLFWCRKLRDLRKGKLILL